MGKNRGVTRAEADTGEGAGASMLERECFCQSTDARRNGEKPASERERDKETRVLANMEDDTERQENG